MAIYVGENKAILLKGDRNVAELYKGGTKLFGFSDPVSGEMLNINDAHPVEHKMKCSVRSKNLLQPKDVGTYIFNSSIDGTYDILDDGGIHIQSLSNTGTTVKNADPTPYCSYTVTESDTYTVSVTGLIEKELYVVVGIKNDSGLTYSYIGNTSSVSTCSLTLTEGNVLTFYLQAAVGAEIQEATMYVQLEKGPTATDYTPCISDLSTVKVQTTGKNLMPIDNYSATIDFGITKEWVSLLNGRYIPIFPNPNNTTYTVIYMKVEEFERNDTTGNISIYLYRKDQLDDNGMPISSPHATISLSKIENGEAKTYYSGSTSFSYVGVTKLYPYIRNTNGTKSTITYKNLMICRSSSYDIEEYKGSICNANADGTVSELTSVSPYMTLTTDTDGVVIECEYVKG